jgi:hypothetical protein
MQRKFIQVIFTCISLMNTSYLMAQPIEGTYRMSGGHEMVSAFQFKKDSSFQFYYIYGAVDRSAQGHFTVHGGRLFLHSDKKPGHDFTVTLEKKSGEGTSIQISDPNKALLGNIAVVFKKGAEQDLQYSNGEGYIHSGFNDCDSISVVHTLFPDVPTLLLKKKPGDNYFVLKLNPSLAEISFRNFTMTITDEGLTGSLPWLFERETALFIKETE